MKDQEYYINKLLALPAQFDRYYAQKKWASAKYVYDTALRVAEFIEIPVKVKQELFGYVPEDTADGDVPPGMFDRDRVSKCYLECAVKSYKGYENEIYRAFGQAPQYFIPPRADQKEKIS